MKWTYKLEQKLHSLCMMNVQVFCHGHSYFCTSLDLVLTSQTYFELAAHARNTMKKDRLGPVYLCTCMTPVNTSTDLINYVYLSLFSRPFSTKFIIGFKM